eukprot:TRINITY_DN73016_c0_g1_i1.p1 TRINITY_DN73016_c0_g1~~TRINITY_DN73016_c0_g1_i1.p1  ORF type:complete len:720 (-),score=82.63 TRINITY_DN73016_c0_g1_i1:54-2213(-)
MAPAPDITLDVSFVGGEKPSQQLTLKPGVPIRIGRNPGSEITIDHLKSVSGSHAEIVLVEHDPADAGAAVACFIRDLSSNGTVLRRNGSDVAVTVSSEQQKTRLFTGAEVVIPRKTKDGESAVRLAVRIRVGQDALVESNSMTKDASSVPADGQVTTKKSVSESTSASPVRKVSPAQTEKRLPRKRSRSKAKDVSKNRSRSKQKSRSRRRSRSQSKRRGTRSKRPGSRSRRSPPRRRRSTSRRHRSSSRKRTRRTSRSRARVERRAKRPKSRAKSPRRRSRSREQNAGRDSSPTKDAPPAPLPEDDAPPLPPDEVPPAPPADAHPPAPPARDEQAEGKAAGKSGVPKGNHMQELSEVLGKLGRRGAETYNVLCHRKKQYQAVVSFSLGTPLEFKGETRSKRVDAEQAAAYVAVDYFKNHYPALFEAPVQVPTPAPVQPLPKKPKVQPLPPVPKGTERHRDITGLKLLGEKYKQLSGEVDIQWDYKLKDEMRRSFAGILKPGFPKDKLDRFWEAVRNGTGWDQPISAKFGTAIPRKTAWMVADGCACTYQYGGLDVQHAVFPSWMIELLETYMPLCGITSRDEWPNSCNLNLYEDGGMSVAWHSDDETLFAGKIYDCPIISLSLGATRTFEVQLKNDAETEIHKFRLESGDLVTMEGMLQKYYQHRVPKETAFGPRINLTWRWVKLHQKQCAKSAAAIFAQTGVMANPSISFSSTAENVS